MIYNDPAVVAAIEDDFNRKQESDRQRAVRINREMLQPIEVVFVVNLFTVKSDYCYNCERGNPCYWASNYDAANSAHVQNSIVNLVVV